MLDMERIGDDSISYGEFTENTRVGEVIRDPAFRGFGRLLFPMDLSISERMTLKQLSSSSVYLWYSDIRTEKTVEILNYLKQEVQKGHQIFYPIYTDKEMQQEPSRKNTGLFYFRGEPGKSFGIMNAGGGFYYVGAMHDSFPHALEVSRQGYHGFALIYRTQEPYDDLARAICFLHDHAAEFQMDPDYYSLWGGSAGARMAAVLGNRDYLLQLTGRPDISQAAAVIMQYTGYSSASYSDAPTYACVGTRDGIADWRVMKHRLRILDEMGIPTEFHVYKGLRHGFGLGTKTVAEGWINDALRFWKQQLS